MKSVENLLALFFLLDRVCLPHVIFRGKVLGNLYLNLMFCEGLFADLSSLSCSAYRPRHPSPRPSRLPLLRPSPTSPFTLTVLHLLRIPLPMAAILDVAQGYLDYLLGQEAHGTSFGSLSTALDVAAKNHSSICGRTFMVTGATSGMGREVAFVLASHGAVVILLSRNAEKLQVTQGQLQQAVVHTITCDLSSLAAVQAAIAAYKALNLTQGLHALICNAGIAFTWRELAPDPEHNWHKHKVESQFATNYLGHFALTLGLMPELIQAGRHGGKARIALVSSVLHHAAYLGDGIRLQDLSGQEWYEPVEAYGQSKLALLLFMEQLERRLEEKNWPVTVNAMHPGMVNSSITRHFIGMCMFPWWQRWLAAALRARCVLVLGGMGEGGGGGTGIVRMGRGWKTIRCV